MMTGKQIDAAERVQDLQSQLAEAREAARYLIIEIRALKDDPAAKGSRDLQTKQMLLASEQKAIKLYEAAITKAKKAIPV